MTTSGVGVLGALALAWVVARPVLAALRRLRTRAAERRRHRLLAADAEPFIDGVAVVLGAGGTVGDALRLLADRGPSSVRAPVAGAVAARRQGASPGVVWTELEAGLGPEYVPTIRALVAAERDGAPLGAVLQSLAAEARAARRTASDAAARELPVRLLFPLVLCALPSVLVGAVLPLALVIAGGTGWF